MAASPSKQYGVTPPISLSIPTKQELEANEALTAELKRQNNFEGQAETERRYALPDLEGVGRRLIHYQKICTSTNTEVNHRICQACEQTKKPSSELSRQRRREDLPIR